MYFSLTISFFLRRNAEISGNFPGNLLVSERNSFRKLYSWAREILTYPKVELARQRERFGRHRRPARAEGAA